MFAKTTSPVLLQHHIDLHVWAYHKFTIHNYIYLKLLWILFRGLEQEGWGQKLAIPISVDIVFYNGMYYHLNHDHKRSDLKFDSDSLLLYWRLLQMKIVNVSGNKDLMKIVKC